MSDDLAKRCQQEFAELCRRDGGCYGGPPRPKVQDLLNRYGAQLTSWLEGYVQHRLRALAAFNPWRVCFAVGLTWGHLAKGDDDEAPTFTEASASLLERWNEEDRRTARACYLERGPDVLEQSLRGGAMMFDRVVLPDRLPTDLRGLHDAQQRWLGGLLSPNRPRYIGPWNGMALFMAAVLAHPGLHQQLVEARMLTLPPGGPVFRGLRMLHEVGVLSRGPSGSDLDDAGFEPGVLFENTALLEELHRGRSG